MARKHRRHQAFKIADKAYGKGYHDALSDIVLAYVAGGGGSTGLVNMKDTLINNTKPDARYATRQLLSDLA